MLELEHASMYPNYVIYLCPECYANNMCNGKDDECHSCGYIMKDIEKLQKILIRRIIYYTKGMKS